MKKKGVNKMDVKVVTAFDDKHLFEEKIMEMIKKDTKYIVQQ